MYNDLSNVPEKAIDFFSTIFSKDKVNVEV